MAASQVQKDVYYLAGHLTHRGANSDSERKAAEYLLDRLAEHAPAARIDDFYSADNPWYLFASYYSEFLVVALVAFWFPGFAAMYGGVVFLSYFAEYMGFSIVSRFLPHYETQNVLASFSNPLVERSIVFVAHYDSRKAGPLSQSALGRWLNYLHIAAAPLMLLVVATCIVQWMTGNSADASQILGLRWTAAAMLLGLAGVVAYDELESWYTAGANDNASGVAALLHLAEHVDESLTDNASVYFVATGSNQNWMSGARQFIRYNDLDKDTTHVIVLDAVGRGQLRYTTRLGMLQVHTCGKELVTAAKSVAGQYGALPMVKRAADSDALPFLARGYSAIEITADPGDQEIDPDDLLAGIDYDLITRAADFAQEVAKSSSANEANSTN